MRRLCAVLCSIQLAWACETAPPLWCIQRPDADPVYRIVEKGKVGYIDDEGRISCHENIIVGLRWFFFNATYASRLPERFLIV